MSVLIEKIKKLNRSESTPIGFRKDRTASSAKKILLISAVKESDAEISGADAVLLEIQDKDTGLTEKTKDDVPWGGRLKSGGLKEIKQLKDSGYDFMVFAAEGMPMETVGEKDIAKILELDTDISDSLLRSVVDLPVDALLVSAGQGKGGSLTWQDLMTVNRFGGIPNKPLLVRIPAKVTAGELEALWEAGAMAVVAEGNIDKLRKTIDKADFTKARKREKNEPVVRQVSSVEDDFEEDDY